MHGRRPVVRVLLVALAALAAQGAQGEPSAVLSRQAEALVGAGQGVHVETEDGTVLVSQAASRAVHPASVSKIPTTLALLRRLGPEHRFTTTFQATAPPHAGAAAGDLRVEAEGDPFFVDENALLVARALREAGVESVDGGLRVQGPLLFNWSADGAPARLRRALAGGASPEAWSALRAGLGVAGAAPALAFQGRAGAAPAAPPEGPRVVHRSQPLVPLLKALNGYSNNIFHPLSQRVGGVAAVQEIARESVPAAMRDEIVITNAAGAGATNRLSPRASVALLRALANELRSHGLDLADVLPVSGLDAGTLRERLDGPGEAGVVVGKTGTFGDHGASALAGAFRSRDHGVVYFAVLNRGVPVPEARRRQDAMVRALLDAMPAEPWPYRPDATPAFLRASVERE